MKRFVVGDIHGGYRALKQVLERSGFDRDHDKLISLGDICDGWPETRQCVAKLLSIKNRVVVLGNHDAWFLDYIETGNAPPIWTSQGGWATLASYGGLLSPVPASHARLFKTASLYHEEDGNFFVHGGFDPSSPPQLQSDAVLMWDRSLISRVASAPEQIGDWKHIFLGHTTLSAFGYGYGRRMGR